MSCRCPDGPQTTRFSCRPIHSRVRSAAWVGAGTEDRRSSQASKVLPVGNAARARRVASADRSRPATSSVSRRAEHLGGVPPLGFGGGQDLGGGAADVRQPHPAQQLFQPGVQRRRGRDARRSPPAPGGSGEVEVVDGQADVIPELAEGAAALGPGGVGELGAELRVAATVSAQASSCEQATRTPRISSMSVLVSLMSSSGPGRVIGLPPSRGAGPSRRCPGPGCALAGPGTGLPRRRAWWARIAARSPSANRPAAAACPSAWSTCGGPVQGGQLDGLRPSWPGSGRCLRRRPRPATARRRPRSPGTRASAAVRGLGVRSSAPGGAGG